jgi:MFS family permease
MAIASTTRLSRIHMIYTVAVIGFIYTLHLVIPMYSNSSYLSLFTDQRTLGYIYMCGAAVTILGFLIAPGIIRRIGNYHTVLWLVILQMVLFYGLVTIDDSVMVAVIFVIQSAVISMIGLCMDIFLEVYTANGEVGSVRGLYTATLNASWVIGPLIGSMLINGTENYKNTYIAALAMLFPLLYLIFRNFPRFPDPNYTHLTPWQLVRHVAHNKSWVWLFFANLLLQTFYAWMTVYSPIYLNKTMGFGWEDIGIILTVMLLPFPLIQYPLGKLSDGRGEKEIMLGGFIIMGLTTIGLAFITSHAVIVWALALFATRVGAAAAEVMMETYFFKTVSPRDAAALGMFRITRPMSYFIAPLITGAAYLFFTTDSYLFIVIGVISLLAIVPVLSIKDTK